MEVSSPYLHNGPSCPFRILVSQGHERNYPYRYKFYLACLDFWFTNKFCYFENHNLLILFLPSRNYRYLLYCLLNLQSSKGLPEILSLSILLGRTSTLLRVSDRQSLPIHSHYSCLHMVVLLSIPLLFIFLCHSVGSILVSWTPGRHSSSCNSF